MYSNIIKYPSTTINNVLNGATNNKVAIFIIASTSICAAYYFYSCGVLNKSGTFSNNKTDEKK